MENKNEQMKTEDNHTKIHPRSKANLLSKLLFCWVLPFFVKGYRKDITEDDLYGPLKVHESKRLGDLMEEAWSVEESKSNPSLWRALTKVFGTEVAMYGIILLFMELVLRVSQPLFIGKLMSYYEPGQTSMTIQDAYWYASSIVLVSLINVLIIHHYWFCLQHIGMKIRIACCSLVYRKSLRLSKSAMAETTVGQMVNLLSNDVNRFDFALIHLHSLWVAPLETALVCYLLYRSVGVTAIAGVGILLIFIPIQLYLGKRTSIYRLRTALKTDQRVRLMNEIISGIQVIKMYTWEKPFAKLVEKARKLEIQQITGTSYIKALNESFLLSLSSATIYLCILTFILTGNVLQAQYVYVVTSFYGVLRYALTMFLPQAVTSLAETNISVKRIQRFLLYDEVRLEMDPKCITKKENENDLNGVIPLIHQTSIIPEIFMENVSAKWILSAPEYHLKDICFKAELGQLVSIVGMVGSGKTTLLHVILKEIAALKGKIRIGGKISYASQEPWLFAGSIRQNILFGGDMDVNKYNQVTKVCALEKDFTLFPYGDRTIVGEKGVMLSGGQKARVNLARAIYKDADIYLLDDPLSAVDAHVGKQLFDDCFRGYLKYKCTILVTHQLQYLKNVDNIYLLQNGTVAASGTYNDIQCSAREYLKLLEKDTGEECKLTLENNKMAKQMILASYKPSSDQIKTIPLKVKEQRGTGTISKAIYISYLKATGSFFVALFVLSIFLFVQFLSSGNDLFLTYWVNLEQSREGKRLESLKLNDTYVDDGTLFTSGNCLYIYTALVSFILILAMIQSISFFRMCIRASKNLHNNMFSQIVYASLRFFNTNPSGWILNRFSQDMGSIDETLPMTIIETIQIGISAFAITSVISFINPWILIPTVVIFGVFYYLRTVFLATSRNLKRLEGTTRSPVFSHITASLQGLTTIRAFNAQNLLKIEFDHHQDLHSSTFYMFLGADRAFGFWLDMICIFYIGIVTLSFLILGTETYGGNVGLAITQSITLIGMLQWGIHQWSELENQMTSVERVIEYTEITPETDDKTKAPPKNWPMEGNVTFQGVSMQYSETGPFILKNLFFSVKSKEKVGIVGRTGAGKSSLIFALFRLCDIEGKIFIDGVDTKEISLNSLRSKISIIPQEPVLFSGTLRKNMDPFDEYDDGVLWKALGEVELKTAVSELPHGLQSSISEGGSNFSVGQRQLLCLARAVIRSNKILIMDEATANVDPHTDELIQRTIRRKFADCTVLTIAHRLHTVMDSDKILVMDAGHNVEFDHPHLLLQNESGLLYGLVKQTGRGMCENLMKKAEENFNSFQGHKHSM